MTNNRIKNQQGFTLVEMILSVGMLAVLSVFLLQLFVTSRTLNRKAYDLDQSVILANQVIALAEEAHLPYLPLSDSLLDNMTEELKGEAVQYRLELDGQWHPVEGEDPAYILWVTIGPEPGAGQSKASLYRLLLELEKTTGYKKEEGPFTLYQLEVVKYGGSQEERP